LSCEFDGLLIEQGLDTGEEIGRLGTHASLGTRLVFSPDGRLAVTSGMDGSLMFWDLESGELVRRSTGHRMIGDVAIAPDGQAISFGRLDTTVVQWRLSNPSLEELKGWVATNRYLPELTCAERERYGIEPLCE
jgi:WD40 repeat protein